MKLFDNPDYVATLRRYSVLREERNRNGLTPEQADELQAADDTLSGIEATHYRSLRGLTNDYDQLSVIGDLGGVELL